MSDKNSETSNENENGNDNVCRDFLRNVCRRGKRCKYNHPCSEEAKDLGKKQSYVFCHDYQNAGCERVNCKYLHCTREEEDYFKQAGQLPVRLQQQAALGPVTSNELPLIKGSIPICKDYLKGACKRTRCKFRHLSMADYVYELRKQDRTTPPEDRYGLLYNPDDYDRFEYEHVSKRRRVALDDYNGYRTLDRYSITPDYQTLFEENVLLRRKVEDLKKQVSDLSATNEVLLEQNARIRASKANSVHMSTAPALVTVTPAMTPIVTPAVGPSSAASAQALSALTASLSQQIALNSELASQQALQQRIAQELAPQGSLGAAALLNPSGSAVGSMNSPIVPVSLAQVQVSLGQGSLPQGTTPTVSMAVSLPQNLNTNVSIAQQTIASVQRAARQLNGPSGGPNTHDGFIVTCSAADRW
ncbi:zinc finger CCCH domain-containing protein 10 [Lingula anatina]|uniref:Zinc finger CCCH domain-containing protein 10 n=1 Tax=Lingula anatina TaxID=7574 RepID=A0A1S3IL48_LINAN|nr:zinc finger CCCH domain-containing protein 10 [Lingula anatina]XP_013398807.1 zinc finger CCCH domain-containing protein 10 [Lingula anatina]XP_013398808.1 zinc finger CCCH domain-containing protein 10 [Lingula anatina]XP_013398809.1 zinc finger CCCH domain-containing protein 10 [Lingula anatina]XP_013398810.1 zinc finger CCCH domain-containing protein 10 [Lingula anatina]XP_013398811.1 zinc finger CCCH domain-containing protein 10 [Lingula anatina]XP_013398812.1 zinc finger CCCH domain-co|eukprot:XP_013398805.1 zinc finger CCCH domain-containing protein 10 [Lingula anatina]